MKEQLRCVPKALELVKVRLIIGSSSELMDVILGTRLLVMRVLIVPIPVAVLGLNTLSKLVLREDIFAWTSVW